MLKIDGKEIYKLERAVRELGEYSMAVATRETLNDTAFFAAKKSKEKISENMIVRNSYTKKQVRVEKTKGKKMSRFAARTGAVVDYLRKQEFGGTDDGAIPTAYSANQGYASQRTKTVRKKNYFSSITLSPRNRRLSRYARNKIAIESGDKFIYLDLGKRKGVFRVIKRGKTKGIHMVHFTDGGKKKRVPKNPWLAPAVVDARAELPKFYAKRLQFQIDRAIRRSR